MGLLLMTVHDNNTSGNSNGNGEMAIQTQTLNRRNSISRSVRSKEQPKKNRRLRYCCSLCDFSAQTTMMMLLPLLLFVATMPSVADATITIVSTGETFLSKQDRHMGQKLWKGYEYMARLQYLQESPTLCPPDDASIFDPDWYYNVTRTTSHNDPDDPDSGNVALPVALLAHGGSCSMAEMADVVLNHLRPAGIVKYIILDGRPGEFGDDADHHYHYLSSFRPSIFGQEQEQFDEGVQQEPLSPDPVPRKLSDNVPWYRMTFSEFQRSASSRENDDDPSDHDPFGQIVRRKKDHSSGEDIPLYFLHVSTRTSYALLDIIVNQDQRTFDQGGLRINLDSRYSTMDGSASLWLALSALLAACSCSFLLALSNHGYLFDSEDQQDNQNAPPRRPRRRRLTREQVKRLFPQYRFEPDPPGGDPETCCGGRLLPLRPAELGRHPTDDSSNDGGRSGDGGLDSAAAAAAEPLLSEAEAAAAAPVPLELSLCSICLDEYESGDRLRCLPCGHAFHSRCIAKWLVERSATCPLCKIDLYDDEEEEEEDDEEEVAPEGGGGEGVEPRGEPQQWAINRAAAAAASSPGWWTRLHQQLAGDLQAETEEVAAEQQQGEQQPPPGHIRRPGPPSPSSWWHRTRIRLLRTNTDRSRGAVVELQEPLLPQQQQQQEEERQQMPQEQQQPVVTDEESPSATETASAGEADAVTTREEQQAPPNRQQDDASSSPPPPSPPQPPEAVQRQESV